MKQAKRFILSLSTLLLVSGLAMSAPVSARDGSDDSTQQPTTTTSSSSNETEKSTEIENHAKDLAEQFRTKAQADLAEKKTEAKAHSQEERQKSCEARKSSLTMRMTNAVTQANKHKEVFDKIYTNVQDFYTTKNLSVANYDTLKASVDKAQSDAAASIAALKSLDVTVDCTSQNVATTVGTFQQALKSTRDSLKAYRSSLTDLIKAIKGASTSTDKTTDSTSNSTTNNQTNQ